MDIDQVKMFFRNIKNRDSSDGELVEVKTALRNIKAQYVSKDDEEGAKNIWCFEQILDVQNLYLEAYELIKSEQYFEAWRELEQCEISIGFLRPHFPIDKEYYLSFISKHVEQYQSLYPYKFFASPEMLIHKQKCNICGQLVSIRNPCGHITGEIYSGEICIREIAKFDYVGFSIVESPVQKYSVIFPKDEKTGESVDCYDYSLLNILIKGLQSPFEPWEMRWTKKKYSHSQFPNLGRNDKCPCGSGKKYKVCCLNEPWILVPHCKFGLPNPSSEENLGVVYS